MHITINKSQFRDEFKRAGRGDQFSYEALGLLFDYFEECEPDYDLDVIAICCEFVEMPEKEVRYSVCCEFVEMSEAEARDSYSISSERDIADFLQENTIYLGATDVGHVFAQF
jgi:hypothetical protein